MWPHQGCARTLVGPPHDRLCMVGSWVGPDHCHVGARPKFYVGVGRCLVLSCRIYITLCLIAHFIYFPLVFKYLSCKTCFLQYKWNYINNKGICVKRLFIFPILDYNWTIKVYFRLEAASKTTKRPLSRLLSPTGTKGPLLYTPSSSPSPSHFELSVLASYRRPLFFLIAGNHKISSIPPSILRF